MPLFLQEAPSSVDPWVAILGGGGLITILIIAAPHVWKVAINERAKAAEALARERQEDRRRNQEMQDAFIAELKASREAEYERAGKQAEVLIAATNSLRENSKALQHLTERIERNEIMAEQRQASLTQSHRALVEAIKELTEQREPAAKMLDELREAMSARPQPPPAELR